jgi:myotubularin-related protein 9
MGNNEAEKRRLRVKQNTTSLWSHVNHPDVIAAFVNALYEPYDQTLWPSVAPQSIVRLFYYI